MLAAFQRSSDNENDFERNHQCGYFRHLHYIHIESTKSKPTVLSVDLTIKVVQIRPQNLAAASAVTA